MNKIAVPQKETFPYSEVVEKPVPVRWDQDALLSLQGLERYTILKAIEEGKNLVKRVIEVVTKDNQLVTKSHVQTAITTVLEEIESSRHKPA